MKKILPFFLFFSLSFSVFSQFDCPLNTPEFPFTTDDSFTNFSWSANLYTSSQMGGAQNLTSISFRLDNDACNGCATYTYSNCKIWVRNTSIDDYATNTGYPGTAGFTEVYSGDFTFSGPGVYTMNFNVAGSFNYNGTSTFEVLFENRGGDDNTWDEPWFDRTNARTDGVFPGKVGWGFSWANAMTISSNRLFNLQINGVTCNAYALPVTLISSSLDCSKDYVSFNWSTASEINNDYFLVESSMDGINWEEESKVKGQGNSQDRIDYSARIDKDINDQVNYYRLSQVDFDGTKEYLNTHSSDCNETEIEIYPNPFSEDVSIINFKGNTIEVLNQLGQKQNVSILHQENSIVLNTELLDSGVYFVVLEGKAYRLLKQ